MENSLIQERKLIEKNQYISYMYQSDNSGLLATLQAMHAGAKICTRGLWYVIMW